jgi:hypothetical protein
MTENNIEERIQRFAIKSGTEEIRTYRRYYSREAMHDLLLVNGFTDIAFTDGYDPDRFYPLSKNPATPSDFICVAK